MKYTSALKIYGYPSSLRKRDKSKSVVEQTDSKSLAKGHVVNIEKETTSNDNFRKVLYTGKNIQLVLMTLNPGEDIGEEVHNDVDQFFRVDEGDGTVKINDSTYSISDGFSIVIPQGAKHNIINSGKGPLKMYTLYAPPQHQDQVVFKTKADASASSEKFDGKITESR